MATITVTHAFGNLMKCLKNGGRILFVGWSVRHAVYRWSPNATSYDSSRDYQVSPVLFLQLKKFKLIEETGHGFRRPVRKVWKITEAGANYSLPPEEFWVNE